MSLFEGDCESCDKTRALRRGLCIVVCSHSGKRPPAIDSRLSNKTGASR